VAYVKSSRFYFHINKKNNKMYPAEMVAPMVAELTNEGFYSAITADNVVEYLSQKEGTTLVVINSVCGCAAAGARPGVVRAIAAAAKRPDRMLTVFAGVDKGAVDKVREYLLPYPPSSPAVALFKNGELVHILERHHIEGRPAPMIAENLKMAIDNFC
jgi:putative YphP/YqiW family bacilliredoxin